MGPVDARGGAAAHGGGADLAPATVPLVPRSGSDRPGTGSFEEVYRASYARMVRTARLLMGSPEAAEEVVQDAFVGLYTRFSAVADPTGYLYRSVVNGCRTGHRRRHLRARLRPSPAPTQVGPPEIDETWAALRRLSMRSRTVISGTLHYRPAGR